MILGFTGTQQGMTERQRRTLKYFFSELQLTELHHGDCIGADAQAHADGATLGAHIVIHPPLEDAKRAFCGRGMPTVLPAKPYLKRNHDIIDATEGLIAAPSRNTELLRSGTWATVRYARKLGRRIWIIKPDGTFVEEKE